MKREIDTVEHDEVPWLSVVLGYGPMTPFVLGAVGVWLTTGVWRDESILLTVIWGAAIPAFLAGVRRGLSFRTEGGPAASQIATMFCLFVMALGALVGLAHGVVLVAAILVLIGFIAIAILDPIAARRGQALVFCTAAAAADDYRDCLAGGQVLGSVHATSNSPRRP